MSATGSLCVASHPDCAAHGGPAGFPEERRRLAAALTGAAISGVTAIPVQVDESRVRAALGRVHNPTLEARLRAGSARGWGTLDDDDTPLSRGTHTSAMAAAAASLAAVDSVASTGVQRVWVPVRPPGHHARANRAMGFCYFNNVAVAVEEALVVGLGPVAVVDFDVHHGNGTQEHFWRRGDVYFLSVHRYPFYPGTGAGDEVGEGRGRGFTRNFPLAAGAGDSTYLGAVEAGLEEILDRLKPRLWLVSAGFDAHRRDPIGGMDVTEAGFAGIGRALHQAAGNAPVIAVLEGGYDLEALRTSVRAFVEGLTGIVPP